MQSEPDRIPLGEVFFDTVEERLIDASGKAISLRPQSLQVLKLLVRHHGVTVTKAQIFEHVWPDVSVTDDSLTQCISDIRRTIGDAKRNVVQTAPKAGYKLVWAKERRGSNCQGISRPVKKWAAVFGTLTVIAVGVVLGWNELRSMPNEPIVVAVLPFSASTKSQLLELLGRGMANDISADIARNPEYAVVGSETVFDAKDQSPLSAAKLWGAEYVVTGEVEKTGETLAVSVRLFDVSTAHVVWSETWTRSGNDYFSIKQDIASRVSASLVAHFWFGALNRAVADRAKSKPAPSLNAYEEYLLGVNNIVWKKADYQKALAHFHRATELEPSYARAWMMIGVVKSWIGDVSTGDARDILVAESRAAFRKAFLYEPHDAMIQFSMSIVHLGEGRVQASQSAVHKAIDLAPNNPDVLAAAAWQSMGAGIGGPKPLEWAKRAIELNPKGPPWHKLGLGSAAFASGDYAASIAAMEAAPPHHSKFLYLAASHMILGDRSNAREAATKLIDEFPDYTLSGDLNFPHNPQIETLVRNARLAGVPLK